MRLHAAPGRTRQRSESPHYGKPTAARGVCTKYLHKVAILGRIHDLFPLHHATPRLNAPPLLLNPEFRSSPESRKSHGAKRTLFHVKPPLTAGDNAPGATSPGRIRASGGEHEKGKYTTLSPRSLSSPHSTCDPPSPLPGSTPLERKGGAIAKTHEYGLR
jgi:hypothetical protein